MPNIIALHETLFLAEEEVEKAKKEIALIVQMVRAGMAEPSMLEKIAIRAFHKNGLLDD